MTFVLERVASTPVTAATLRLLVLKIRLCVCFAAAKVNHKSITEKAYFGSIEKKKSFTMMKEGFRMLSNPCL